MKLHFALGTALALVACGGSNDAMKEATTVNGASSTGPTGIESPGDTTAGNPGISNASAGAGAPVARTTGAQASDGTSASKQPAPPKANTGSGSAANGAGGGPTNAGAAAVNTPSSSAKAPDNTGVNERDRGTGAPTAVSQGNSQSEINISAAIRRAVVGNKALGFNAKNVKIITVGSKVTLRGPVSTDQERGIIEMQAKQTSGVTEVDNQIEVKR